MRALIGPDLLRKLEPKAIQYFDTKLVGFVLRCRPSGTHSYIMLLGRGRSKTIGHVGEVTPEAARLTAESMRAAVSKGTLSLMADDPTITLTEAKAQARGNVRRTKAGRQTLGTYVRETYGPWVREHRKSGAITERKLLAQFPDFVNMPIREISAFAIERWRTARHKAGIMPATTNRDLAALRGCLSKAVEWKDLRAHPMIGVKMLKVDKLTEGRYLSADEEQRLRDTLTARDDRRRTDRDTANVWRRERDYPELPAFGGVYTDHLTPIVLLALNTGLRRGELFDLRWRDLDLSTGRLMIPPANAKSGKARAVPLNREAVDVLAKWRPTPWEPGDLVFAGDEGERMVTLKTAFLKVVKDAGLPDFRFHDLRHSFASKLVQRGVDLERLRQLLGHRDTKMVTRYAHLRDEDLAAAVAKLAGA